MKKQHFVLSSLRPQIEKLLEVEECLNYFKIYCTISYTSENLDCILAIKNYGAVSDNQKKHQLLKEIYETYLADSSEKTVNINSTMKNNIYQFTIKTPEFATTHQNDIDKYLDEIRDELIGILGYRMPHFVESKEWHEFTANFSALVPRCLNETNQSTLQKIRYSKKDFMRDRLSQKDILLCEFMKDDQSMFKLQKSDDSGCLSVYTCNGKDILDEDDIGMGKFQGFKVAGSLPYPPWLIVLALASSKFHSGIWDGYLFDREYDFKHIPSSNENGELFYDTHIAKLVVDYGKLLKRRSCYCITENMYSGNRTYMFSRSITPQNGLYEPNCFKEDFNSDLFGDCETHNTNLTDTDAKINMKGRKKCVHMPLMTLFSIQPFGDNQSLFSYSSLTNPGGFILSKLGTPKSIFMNIAGKYREKLINGLKELLANDRQELKKMKDVYNTVKTRLDRYKKASNNPLPHIFEAEFEDQLKMVKSK